MSRRDETSIPTPDLRRWQMPVTMLLVGLALLGGCASPSPQPQRPRIYTGPTETMSEVVAAIDANASRVPTLWARHEFDVTIYDENRRATRLYGDGVLLYRRPRDLRLDGNHPVAGPAFQVASNGLQYWMRTWADEPTLWWGWHENIGKPCAGQIPIRPDMVREVLGLAVFGPDLLAEPAPVMRFNNDADVYMFVWSQRQGQRWSAVKEIWYDRQTKRPLVVLLFDGEGRVVLRAHLGEHRAIEGAGDAPAAVIAHQFSLFFPDSGSKMSLTLTTARLRQGTAPADRAFRFPDATGARVIQVDGACEGEMPVDPDVPR